MQNKKLFGANVLFTLDLTPTQAKWNSGLSVAIVNISNCYYAPMGQSISKQNVSINGSNFCLNIEQDSGTGGQTSRDYYYTTKKGDSYLLLNFHIDYNRHCGKYPEYDCSKFEEIKDTAIFNQILSTFRFLE